METTIVCWGSIRIMQKKMETTIEVCALRRLFAPSRATRLLKVGTWSPIEMHSHVCAASFGNEAVKPLVVDLFASS